MEIKAYGKLNLALDVLGKRTDGYHELETVMCAINVFDTVWVEFGGRGITVEADPPLPGGSAVYRAALAYIKAGETAGARIRIARSIPEGAGLGGSSADAAAVLRALDAHYGALGEKALYALAAEVGADVPFLLKGGCAFCAGKGERLEPLPGLGLTFLVVMPERGVSTKAAFAALVPPYARPTARAAAEAIRRGDEAALFGSVSNGLSAAGYALCPKTEEYVERLRSLGASAAAMTGSGSAAFGIFPSGGDAKRAGAAFRDAAFTAVANMV